MIASLSAFISGILLFSVNKDIGGFLVFKGMRKAVIKDVTKEWKRNARPKDGEIEISEYTIAKSGRLFDKTNAKFGTFNSEEKKIGTWFKNTIWGDVRMQRGLMEPEHEPSADLLILNNCPFLEEQTIEIKTLRKTKRIDGVDTRLKSGRDQSANILIDITKSSLETGSVIRRAKKILYDSSWLKVLIIKNYSSYIVY